MIDSDEDALDAAASLDGGMAFVWVVSDPVSAD